MSEAAELLDYYVSETGDQNANVYVVAHLKTLISSSGRLDTSVEDLLERVRSGESMRRE